MKAFNDDANFVCSICLCSEVEGDDRIIVTSCCGKWHHRSCAETWMKKCIMFCPTCVEPYETDFDTLCGECSAAGEPQEDSSSIKTSPLAINLWDITMAQQQYLSPVQESIFCLDAVDEAIDMTGIPPEHIDLVINHTNCTLAEAVDVLRRNNNDVQGAIMEFLSV